MKDEMYHFIGLGGIGMSALARILLQRGAKVQGSDAAASALLEELRNEGAQSGEIEVASKVIYSSAIPEGDAEFVKAKKMLLPLLHRSELLHVLMQGARPLLVTGTHGKTTTTSLLASVLVEAKLDPSFVIGGIHQKWKTNARAGKGAYFVAEADESDGSFLKTPAFGAIVTNLENDHLDFWKDERLLDKAFGEFFAQANPEHLFWCGDDARLSTLHPKGTSYGFGPTNALQITSFEPIPTGIRFSLGKYKDIELSLFGRHNALNGGAVFGLTLSLGVPEAIIRKAFREFEGTARRLEWKGAAQGIDVYDDYGHHPTEIQTTLQGLRGRVLERRIVAVFQPHRYTRVRDLFNDFWVSFEEADLVVLTEIYGAGEKPIEGISSESFHAQMKEKLGDKLLFIPRQTLENDVAELLIPHDVVMTIGAGDVTGAGPKILDCIKKNNPKLTVGLLFGGTSSEHAVSLMSARTFVESIDRSLYNVKLFGITKTGQWLCGPDALEKLAVSGSKLDQTILDELTSCDVAIPIFHGQQGEDGMMQGLLDTLNIPYVGCDYRSSALCMQKGWTKQVAKGGQIPTSPFIEMERTAYFNNPQSLVDQIQSYPVWIKPVHLGSSIGVTRVTGPEGVHAAARLAFALDDVLIADKEVAGREIEFAVLGNEFIRVGPIVEVVKPDVFHSYEKKYGATASPFKIPAPLTESQIKIGKALAIEMFKLAGCKGLARIDFFLDNEGQFWMNEINPMPGFTKTSAYPQSWEVGGLSMRQLCNEFIILALQRTRRFRELQPQLCGK